MVQSILEENGKLGADQAVKVWWVLWVPENDYRSLDAVFLLWFLSGKVCCNIKEVFVEA